MFKRSTTTLKRNKQYSKRGKFIFSKRRKFVIVTLILSLGPFLVYYSDISYRYLFISILAVLTALLSAWSLKEDMHKIGWLMGMIMPVLFGLSMNLFFFLLPKNIFVQLLLLAVFAIGMYAILLINNIYLVALYKTIQLFKAANALGFVISLIIMFMLTETVFSYKIEPWWNALYMFIITFPIALQGVWASKLEENLSKEVIMYSLGIAWLVAQGSFFISMWPLTINFYSLFLVTLLYISLGIVQQAMLGRMFKKTIYEYVRIGVIVFIIIFFSSKWGG